MLHQSKRVVTLIWWRTANQTLRWEISSSQQSGSRISQLFHRHPFGCCYLLVQTLRLVCRRGKSFEFTDTPFLFEVTRNLIHRVHGCTDFVPTLIRKHLGCFVTAFRWERLLSFLFGLLYLLVFIRCSVAAVPRLFPRKGGLVC